MYKIKGKVNTISVDIKMTFKVRDNYFSVQAHEERSIPTDDPELDMEREYQDLWDELYVECEDQANILKKQFRGKIKK